MLRQKRMAALALINVTEALASGWREALVFGINDADRLEGQAYSASKDLAQLR